MKVIFHTALHLFQCKSFSGLLVENYNCIHLYYIILITMFL